MLSCSELWVVTKWIDAIRVGGLLAQFVEQLPFD